MITEKNHTVFSKVFYFLVCLSILLAVPNLLFAQSNYTLIAAGNIGSITITTIISQGIAIIAAAFIGINFLLGTKSWESNVKIGFYASICIFSLAALLIVTPGALLADVTQDDAIQKVICNVVVVLTGNIARGVSMIAIIVIGAGMFVGKFSVGLGLTTVVGIALLNGSPTIVGWIVGSDVSTLCTSVSDITNP